MIKRNGLLACFLLFFIILVQPGLYGSEADEELPIKITFQNSSDHPVLVHVISYDMIEASYNLEPKRDMEIEVAFGNKIELEYPPAPHRTVLSEMGSLNELYRTVYLRNDGEHLFIEEKFSGQRIKGKGEKRIPRPFISEPELEPRTTQKSAPDQPEHEKMERDRELLKKKKNAESLLEKKMKPTRKEDPDQPENKKEKKEK
jgi:hypothetical protein